MSEEVKKEETETKETSEKKEEPKKEEPKKEVKHDEFIIKTKDDLIRLLKSQQAQISELKQIVDTKPVEKKEEKPKEETKVNKDLDEVSKLILE